MQRPPPLGQIALWQIREGRAWFLRPATERGAVRWLPVEGDLGLGNLVSAMPRSWIERRRR